MSYDSLMLVILFGDRNAIKIKGRSWGMKVLSTTDLFLPKNTIEIHHFSDPASQSVSRASEARVISKGCFSLSRCVCVCFALVDSNLGVYLVLRQMICSNL